MGAIAGRVMVFALMVHSARVHGQGRPESRDDAPITVRYAEGVVHGFLVLRSESGSIIAHGDLLQTPKGGAVTTETVFRFGDGSVLDEKAVFAQDGVFKLLSYHLEQRGPAFDRDLEFDLVRSRGSYRLTTKDHEDGKEESDSDTVDMPADLYNGMVPTIVKSLAAGDSATVHLLALTPKPRMIQLEMKSREEGEVLVGAHRETTAHWVLHPKLGTLTGFFAKLLGKTPPDNHIWVATEGVPAIVRFEGPLYVKGPVWRIELSVPTWPEPK
jgi:hypothetical protein